MGANLIILAILSLIGFYNYHDMVSLPVRRAMFMFMLIVCFFVAMRNKKVRLVDSSFPRLPWLVLSCGLIVSVFMAYFYHMQPLVSSFIAQSTPIFIFGSFFVMIKLNPDPNRLIKGLLWMLIPTTLVFFVNFYTIPNNMFGETLEVDLTRGIMRVRCDLIMLYVLFVFYGINKWHTDHQYKWLGLAAACFMMIIMSVTRQLIAIVGVLAFFQFLAGFSWVKKVCVGLVIAGVGYITVINLPMYQDMKELTEDQIDSNDDKEDVRLGASRYYFYEGNESVATFLFGNGTPSFKKTIWGKRFEAFTDETGYLLADVSWAAMVYTYGLFAAIALLVINLMSIFKHKPRGQQYLTYFMISTLLLGIAGGTWFVAPDMFINCIVLYLIYRVGNETVATHRQLPAVDGMASMTKTFVVK